MRKFRPKILRHHWCHHCFSAPFRSKKRSNRPTFRNPEKFVFSCQTSKVAPEPPSSLVFRQKLQTFAVLRIPFSAPTSLRVPARRARHRFDSPPRTRLGARLPAEVVRQPAELVTADVTAPSGSVFGAKKAQNGQVRRVRFPCRTASGMAEPQVSLVFGRKRAPDDHFAQASAFGPENRRIPARQGCHRSSPLRHRFVTGEKCAKAVPEAPKKPNLNQKSFVTSDVTASSPLRFWSKKALKTANSEKCVFRALRQMCCLASKFARFPPKTGSRCSPCSEIRFLPRKACEFQPALSLSPPMSPVSNTSACRGTPPISPGSDTTARQGPLPRFSHMTRQPAEVVTANVTGL